MSDRCLKTHSRCVVVFALALVAAFVCVDVARHPAAYVRLGTQRLGPGPGEWLVEAPEVHDLSAADLVAAGDRHARELASRDCLVVAKDGVIVHERYHNGANADSLHFVDGAGKTATALLVGALVKSHGLDLDEPLARYGVEAPELAGQLYDVEWDSDAWSKVTTRHLLARVTGAPAASPGADAVPGASFDASEALQRRVLDRVVPSLVEKLTGVEATRWARERLGEPIGAPELFERSVRREEEEEEEASETKEKEDDSETKSHSRAPPDATPTSTTPTSTTPTSTTRLAAAGGQMVTCRAAARLGQLVANRGEWLTERGDVVSLVDGWFVDQMLTPSFPRANAQYGYLGWTHPGAEPALKKGGEGSGSSRGWGGSSISFGSATLGRGDWSAYTEEDTAVIRRRCDWPGAEAKFAARDVDEERGDGALLGSDGPVYPLAIAQGELGKFILASPHANLVVVSMGNTWGADASCPVDIRPGGAGISGAEEDSDREAFAEEAFRRAHVDPQSVKIPEDPFASYAREDDGDLQAAAIRTIVADAARDAAAGLALAPRKPSLGEADESSSRIVAGAAAAESDPYARGVFSGAVDEVATLRALWSVVGAAVTPRENPWTSGDRRTMWQTMRGGVGAGRAAKRAEREAEAEAAARKAAAARIAAEEAGAAAAAAASAAASASASAGLGRARSDAAAAREKRSAARGESRDPSEPSGNVAAGKRRRAKSADDDVAVLGKRTSSSSSPGHHGSCRCSCPPASALGQCVDMRGVSARSCDYDELVGAAAGFCPSMGVLGSSFTPLASSTGSSESSSESVRPGRLGGFACLPSADGLASFLCEPVSFGSCAWSDAPCGGETEYAATRSASSSLGAGENGAGGGRAGDLVLTTPSRASYVDLRYGSKDDGESRGSSGLGADEAGDGSTAAEGRRRFDEDGGSNNPRGLIHQTRETIAALAVLGVAALLMTTRVARAYVLDPIFSPVVSPTVLNSVGIDPQTPLTPAEKKGAKYYGGLD